MGISHARHLLPEVLRLAEQLRIARCKPEDADKRERCAGQTSLNREHFDWRKVPTGLVFTCASTNNWGTLVRQDYFGVQLYPNSHYSLSHV